jgi:hypothetical protein
VYGVNRRADLRQAWDQWAAGRPNLLFEHCSGLGVLAAGDAVAEPLQQLLRESAGGAAIRDCFAGLGRAVELERQRRMLASVLAQQQTVLDAWQSRIGLATEPPTAPAIGDPLPLAQRVVTQLDAALVEDLRLRDQLRQLQSSQTQPEPARPERADHRISIIICSIDNARFTAVSAMYERLLADVPHEIIRIPDARGMSEGYNRGIDRSSGDVLIFSHDDIEFITADFAQRLLAHLERFDLVGLAGTTLACGNSWFASAPPYLFGQVTNPDPRGGFTVSLFGAPTPLIDGIQAVDGLFFAVNRRVVERVRFDETFDGFHFYDLDFSLSVFHAGFKMAVANDIHAIHASTGQFTEQWQRYVPRFQAKWQSRLPPRPERPLSFCGVSVRTKQEVLEIVRPAIWNVTAPEQKLT